MNSVETKKEGRVSALDYLRGFFIAVIIIDHVNRFPSLGTYVTGEARLWMTAAEGFVIISGFLIGYVRGFKGLKLPFKVIADKLGRRALLLYLWTILTALSFALIDWYVTVVPNVPTPPTPFGNIWALLIHTATFQSAAVWTYFLMLYTIFLFLSIGVVYLLRKNQIRLTVILTLIVYLYGFTHDIEWMKWQVVFFLPAIAGYYYPRIQEWWSTQSALSRKRMVASLHTLSLSMLMSSIVFVFHSYLLPGEVVKPVNNIFDIEVFGPLRVLLAFLWFVSLAFLFDRFLPFIKRWTYGILEYFGTHSLTAYIVHGFVLCFMSATLAMLGWSSNFILNTLIGLTGILLVYWLIRIPLIARIIPR